MFYTTGALNPLSPFGKCSHLEHRQILARSFATSTAIYADYAIASDSITQLLRQEPFDIVAIEQLHNDFLVIQELMPLLYSVWANPLGSVGSIIERRSPSRKRSRSSFSQQFSMMRC